MTEEAFDDAKMMRGEQQWGGDTLCLKKRPLAGEKPGAMGYTAFGVITQAAKDGRTIVVYLRGDGKHADWARTKSYQTVDALLVDGWIVD